MMITPYTIALAHEFAGKAYWEIRHARMYLDQICRDTEDPDACELARDIEMIERRVRELVEKFNQII